MKMTLPFRNMTSGKWQNLALAALAVFYLIQIGLEVFWQNACAHLAIDYCAFWSAGRIANTYGYPQIYNLTILKQVQASISPPAAAYSMPVSPIAYLPIFIIPFQFLARLNPTVSYWLWAVANLLALAGYLWFFVRRTGGQLLPLPLLTMFLLSLPVYWNFFNGQVNVWLVICVGEMMRASMSGKPLLGGLWLAGLLIKPQVLLLIVSVLLLQRATRFIAGLLAASAAILGASLLMIGTNGFRNLIELWLGFSGGLPTNDIGIMMNWRMLGATLGDLTTPGLGWILTAAGLIATFLAVLFTWRHAINTRSEEFAGAWLGLLAGTGLFAWHSHVHMAMILIPPLLYLSMQGALSIRLLRYWAFLPATLYFLAFIAAALIQAKAYSGNLTGVLDFLRGAGEFGMNLAVLIWAVKKSAADYKTQP